MENIVSNSDTDSSTLRSAHYIDSSWLQQLLLVVVNMSLWHNPQPTLFESSLSGCLSLDKRIRWRKNVSIDSDQTNVHVIDLNMSAVITNTQNLNGSPTSALSIQNKMQNWMDYQDADAFIFCTDNLQPMEVNVFHLNHSKISTKASAEVETTGRGPFAREIQILLGIFFCTVLALCLFFALILRIRSCVRRQLASRRHNRYDRDGPSRVHFAYDVGDTEVVTKPPVPSTTFGSNVYPSDYVFNPRSRNGHIATRRSGLCPYSCGNALLEVAEVPNGRIPTVFQDNYQTYQCSLPARPGYGNNHVCNELRRRSATKRTVCHAHFDIPSWQINGPQTKGNNGADPLKKNSKRRSLSL
ncbi:unnamed protein product [Calicophoron daubneyi]|uniref:Uncharacterized protein n=1 Tax=Calicophoron daubneyi TaxID=300641 RepID=A0AAV2TPW8_CALDB